MEGWHFLDINRQVAGFDKVFGLPNPQIQTIYPAGPLPAKCPAGMVKLQSYGSCNAWKGELTLDVIAAHLIAPYAKIIISATPADTEITGRPGGKRGHAGDHEGRGVHLQPPPGRRDVDQRRNR